MARALRLTEDTWPHPNPRVGAVVLSADGAVAGERAHRSPGTSHAEAAALEDAGDRARGGTVVVTLEPCNHHGRTPPCTEAIVDAGIATVVVAALDPDPRVSGTGIERLRRAGVEVITGVEAESVIAADPGYFHHRRTGRPRVTLKLAATLDGQVAAADGTSQWITGDEARRDVHQRRANADAVAVGAGTLLADDPLLTARIDGHAGPQPRPVVVAGARPLPADRALFDRSPIVYAPRAIDVPAAADLVEMPGVGGVDLVGVVKDLGARGILDLYVEGGPSLAASFARGGLVDEYVFYLAGKIGAGFGKPMFDSVFGTLADARSVTIIDIALLGADLRIRAVPTEVST